MRDCPGLIEVDEAVGEYRIVVLRNEPFGNPNGYLGVPLHSSHYGDDYDVPVHGGWTYFGETHPLAEKSDGYWWFGFDTAHLGDRFDEERCAERYGQDSAELHIVERLNGAFDCEDSHLWTVEEVREELLESIKSISN